MSCLCSCIGGFFWYFCCRSSKKSHISNLVNEQRLKEFEINLSNEVKNRFERQIDPDILRYLDAEWPLFGNNIAHKRDYLNKEQSKIIVDKRFDRDTGVFFDIEFNKIDVTLSNNITKL
jgi:hypothetical protein